MKTYMSLFAIVVGFAVVALNNAQTVAGMQGAPAAAAAPAPRAPLATFDTTKLAKLDLVEAKARYKVLEQLVGIDFGNEAVGTTDKVTGTLVLAPDGSVEPQSKIVVDLRTLTSDQEMRDNYIRTRTLEVEKFPMLEFVPKRLQGLKGPLPSPPQAQAIGFQLIGDMTLHGVTKEAVWSAVATLRGATVAGRATTTVLFSDFNLTKPAVPLLLKADDKIQLEVEFKMNRSAL